MEYFDMCNSLDELEREHKLWVVKLHPDRNPDNPNATAEFQEMQAQYEERKAVLNGDYTAQAKGQERRAQQERERKQREAKEQEQREAERVEQAVNEARINRQRKHTEWLKNAFVYARVVDFDGIDTSDGITIETILMATIKNGTKDAVVVLMEDRRDVASIVDVSLGKIEFDPTSGGYETLQSAKNGQGKAKRVARVTMVCDEQFCIFGNQMGDTVFSTYYVPENYETMYADVLDALKAEMLYRQQEDERQERERQERLAAEQMPLIDEWRDTLITLTAGLNEKEREQVAMQNLKTMLEKKFRGTKFTVKRGKYGTTEIKWTDGPTADMADEVVRLFNTSGETTPWTKCYGEVWAGALWCVGRTMSTMTKARILSNLTCISQEFGEKGMFDTVTLSPLEWAMMHAMAGVTPDVHECGNRGKDDDGNVTVLVTTAVDFIFNRNDYSTKKETKKTTKKAA